jgi:hypothetical protein
MANRGGIILVDGIGPVLGYLAVSSALNVAEGMSEGREKVELYARSNAPWSDITGMARQGLTASVYQDGGEIVLELAHTEEYGYWLEVIQDGRFAIIMPTLETLAPEIIRDAGGRITQTEGGY